MQHQITSKYLGISTELTVVMPLKQGLVEALGGTKTYATRLRALLRTLNQIRKISVEERHIKAYTDPIERLRTINDFRWCIFDNDTQLLLAVTFDSAWETYIRKIADDAGPLLDVILCHCEGYEEYASTKGYYRFAEWARKHQIETDFFYSATGDMTVDDMQYLKQLEHTQRNTANPANFDTAAARLQAINIEKAAQQTAQRKKHIALDQGLSTLEAMFQLAPYFENSEQDKRFLHAATKAILQEFDSKALVPAGLRQHHEKALHWFENTSSENSTPAIEDLQPTDIQGDLLKPYRKMTHSCLLLMRVLDQAGAAKLFKDKAFLKHFEVTKDGAPKTDIAMNIAFTYRGLQELGLTNEDLSKFPVDFREGMEARAGVLGDVRSNHPKNWKLPKANWPLDNASENAIPLHTVDFVIQLQTSSVGVPGDHQLVEGHPLLSKIQGIDKIQGVQILAVEPLRRYRDKDDQVRGHFNFHDGISQPQHVLPKDPKKADKDLHKVALGDLLWGYPNDRGQHPPPSHALLNNGSFLVMRKLKQDVQTFDHFLSKETDIDREVLKAKMMGRYADGTPLIPLDKKDKTLNDFDYSSDPNGDLCPLQSHIRRTFPRAKDKKVPDPRILRRGFSYGPNIEDLETQGDRGLMFMAYNSSIAEQFEVIQRWVSGGNSTDVMSAQHDPILGVPKEDEKRTLRFIHNGEVKRFDLGDKPFVSLEWGMYLFMPSLTGMAALAEKAEARAQNPVDSTAQKQLVEQGKKLIEKLKLAERLQPDKDFANHWKAILEDPSSRGAGLTEAVWAAIRKKYNGVLKTPYGVLVGNLDYTKQILCNPDAYSVREYWDRMRRSLGQGYLGMDPDPQKIADSAGDSAKDLDKRYHAEVHCGRYRAESEYSNPLISKISEDTAFDLARDAALNWLREKGQKPDATIPLKLLLADVFADLSHQWFGIPQKPQPPAGRQTVQSLIAVAGYVFNPNPIDVVKKQAEKAGQFVAAEAKSYVESSRKKKSIPTATVSGGLFKKIQDDEQLARTVAGIAQGFMAPTSVSFFLAMNNLIKTGQLWRLQQSLLDEQLKQNDSPIKIAKTVLRPALMEYMQRLPSPDQIHRTAVQDIKLGKEQIKAGERVVLGLISATREQPKNVEILFGGNYGQKDAPIHSCPGQSMAMGALLGTLSAILEAGELKPHPFLLTLSLSNCRL